MPKGPRPLTEEQRAELEHTGARMLTMIEAAFDRERSNIPGFDLKAALCSTIEQVVREGNRRGMKYVVNDMTAMVRGMSGAGQARVDAALRAKFGEGLVNEEKEYERVVARILRRKAIRGGSEYETVKARIDDVYADPSPEKQDEYEQLKQILVAYEDSRSKRSKRST